ncbi:aldehyde dehydrogenase family protein [Pseudomonas sp. 43NM1]|uniref:aldehyde dehydrogenase family protein n=1 Tax=Pseudomonas sp. 43NM1 TaxID=1904755 RepID=UPI0012FF3DCF
MCKTISSSPSDFNAVPGRGRVPCTSCAQSGVLDHRLASGIDSGMEFINSINWSDTELPIGGIKHSGYGRELGEAGIQTFVNKKLVRYAFIAPPI